MNEPDYLDINRAPLIHATIRTPRGRDVGAACGQLRHASQQLNKMA